MYGVTARIDMRWQIHGCKLEMGSAYLEEQVAVDKPGGVAKADQLQELGQL